MEHAALLQSGKQNHENRQHEQSDQAEELEAEIHRDERHDGRKSDLFSDDARFKRVAHDRNDEVQPDKLECLCAPAQQQLDCRPGEQNRAGADDRQNIQHRDEQRQHGCILQTQDEEAGKELGKGQQK